MHKAQSQVREFHRDVIDAPISPAEPRFRNARLRAALILEEAIETVEALVGTRQAREMVEEAAAGLSWENGHPNQEPNLVEAIDGLCDTIVVSYGTAEEIGIDLEPFYDEVMRSNMAKRGGPVRADGKRLKPPGWTPPDLESILDRVRRGSR